jgi:hypothetical protein
MLGPLRRHLSKIRNKWNARRARRAMLKGTVSLQAQIRGKGVTFPSFEFNPREPGVDKVVIEAPADGSEIRIAVHFASVASVEEAGSLASKVTATTLDRLAFTHVLVIENHRVTGSHFSPVNPPPGVLTISTGSLVIVGSEVGLVHGMQAAAVKAQLELANPPGERNYSLFRLARQATSPVEEFMVLYNILLMPQAVACSPRLPTAAQT